MMKRGLIILLLISLSLWGYRAFRQENFGLKAGRQAFQELSQNHVMTLISGKTAGGESPGRLSQTDRPVDFAALKEQNPDMVAWLYVDGTGIDYPVVQAENNSYYLHHSFSGSSSAAGTLFLDCSNTSDFSDGNSIIHGHNMFDGGDSMFSSLIRYTDATYLEEHSIITLGTPKGEQNYQIFAVCQFDITAPGVSADFYKQDFRNMEAWIEYVHNLQSQSAIQTGIRVSASGHLLTLSTCDQRLYGNAGRIIVVGYQTN